jgi:hypothetical protein
MLNNVESLASEIQGTAGFFSRLFSRKFGFLMLIVVFVGIALTIILG